jgi:elongation factor Ts
MAAITASMVAELRAKTDAPMMECKKALTEAEGDLAKAEELLRVKLGTKAGKAASRVTAEGVIAAFIEGNKGAMIEVNSETDFVSKNDSFIAMANAAAKLVAEHNPADVAALSALAYEQDGFGPTLEDVRKGLIGKIGENMSFRRFKRFVGTSLASYLHGSRIGVVVEFDGDATAAKDVAMHVAAMKPVSVTSADVPAELIEKERTVAAAKAAESGKPADIVAKMVEGSVQKYLKEVSLADQVFVTASRPWPRCSRLPTPTSRASPCTWSAKASRRRLTTSLPKWLPRWLPPRPAPDPSRRPNRSLHHPSSSTTSEKHHDPRRTGPQAHPAQAVR